MTQFITAVCQVVHSVPKIPAIVFYLLTILTCCTTKLPRLWKKRQGSGLAQSDFEKASEFNGQFTDVFTKIEHSQVPLLDRSAPFMEDIVVIKEGATKLQKGLNPYKA